MSPVTELSLRRENSVTLRITVDCKEEMMWGLPGDFYGSAGEKRFERRAVIDGIVAVMRSKAG
jgi:hypothetical protein